MWSLGGSVNDLFSVFAGWSKQFQMSSNVYSVINIDWSSVKNRMNWKHCCLIIHTLSTISIANLICLPIVIVWNEDSQIQTKPTTANIDPQFLYQIMKKKRSRPIIHCNNTVKIIQQHVAWMYWTASPLARKKKKHKWDGRKDKACLYCNKKIGLVKVNNQNGALLEGCIFYQFSAI